MNFLEELLEKNQKIGDYIELSIVGVSVFIAGSLAIHNGYQAIQRDKEWAEKSEERRRAKCVETIQVYITPEAFEKKRNQTIETYCQSIFPDEK